MALGAPSYTSVPQNVSVSLGQYQFVRNNDGSGSGGMIKQISYDNVTGLPTQPVTEPYPDGAYVNTANGGCEMYMLLWYVQVSPSHSQGGGSYFNALTGIYVFGSASQFALSMRCP